MSATSVGWHQLTGPEQLELTARQAAELQDLEAENERLRAMLEARDAQYRRVRGELQRVRGDMRRIEARASELGERMDAAAAHADAAVAKLEATMRVVAPGADSPAQSRPVGAMAPTDIDPWPR
jgi:predicted nuclease with TOPRIM domain